MVSPPFYGTPEQAARTFLQEHAPALLHSEGAGGLWTDEVRESPAGTHVRFLQTVRGIPVHGADVVVSLDRERRVRMVVSNARRTARLAETVPGLTAGEAVLAARAALGASADAVGNADTASLTAFETPGGTWRLAYRVTMTREHPAGDWEIMIDALDGRELARTDLFVRRSGASITGTGFVYLQDPLTASGRMYGSPGFLDADDADSDSLTRYRTAVPLDSLTLTEGLVSLEGPWCTVTDIESPPDPAGFAVPTPGDFAATRSDQLFEAVSVYYHVSASCRHLESLGFLLPRLRQLRVDPHGYQGQDNSHYSPTGNWIAFGEGGVDDAEDADVIWHEHAHAIIFAIVPGWGGGESGALGEGIADYWAASCSRAAGGWPVSGYHYQWLFNWDGHNPFWAGRILNDSRTYPFGPLPMHSAGQIVSAALMGIQDDLGRTLTDRLVIAALYYLGAGAMAQDFSEAMIEADRALYGGIHLATLVHWLGTVKHFIDPAPYLSAATGEELRPREWALGPNYPNPFNASTSIPFTLPIAARVRLSVHDVTGRAVATLFDGYLPPGAHTVRWDGRISGGGPAGSGLYFYRLEAENGVIAAAGSMLLVK